MIKELIELFNKPKEFVEQCQHHLSELGYADGYDYDRFIKEELGELISNHENGKHDGNRALLVDDICDSLWVVLAATECISFTLFALNKNFETNNTKVIQYINTQLDFYNSIGSENLQESLTYLSNISGSLILLAILNDIDIVSAFSALVEENMSKLNFPPEQRAEVFRDGKCNKKDPQGNLYPWYKPADFSRF